MRLSNKQRQGSNLLYEVFEPDLTGLRTPGCSANVDLWTQNFTLQIHVSAGDVFLPGQCGKFTALGVFCRQAY